MINENNYQAIQENLYAEDCEKAVLASCFLRENAIDSIPEYLESIHFGDQNLGEVFKAFKKVHSKGLQINPQTVVDVMEKDVVERVGGISYLVDLVVDCQSNYIVFGNTITHYADKIYDCYKKRELRLILEDTLSNLISSQEKSDNSFENIEKKIFNLTKNKTEKTAEVQLYLKQKNYLERIDENFKGGDKGVSTGFKSIEKFIGKLKPSGLYILAGRPGMGKTALATNIAFNVAHQEGKNVLFCSLEMSGEEISGRILSGCSEVPFFKFETGSFSFREFDKAFLTQRDHQEKNVKLFIDDTAGRTVASVLSQSRRFKRQHGLDLIVIDHLHLMKPEHHSPNSVREITQLTGDLKALTKELNIPVLVLAQLNRGTEAREDKRPELSNLRQSGSIEQDADVVMFVYREGYYKRNDNPESEVIIAKNRQGKTGVALLNFDSKFTKFADLEK